MFCVKCGNPISAMASFCKRCGSAVRSRTATHLPKPSNPKTRPPKPKRSKAPVIAAIAIFVSLGIGVFFLWGHLGLGGNSFDPDDPLTRAQFAGMVVEQLETPADTEEIFSDVPTTSPYNAWVTAAVRRGIIFPDEYGENLGADTTITQEEAVIWMVRALGVGAGDITTAVEIGLIDHASGGSFEPAQQMSHAQGAEFIRRMSSVLESIAPEDFEEVFHYIYRSDVTAISQSPAYSFVETNGTVIITVYSPNNAIRQLTVGDTFVLEPTEQNPDGMSGHITSIAEQGASIIITARLPQSLEEIFYEFEFTSEIDLLDLAEDIILAEDLQGVDGVEIVRNRTSFVGANLSNARVAGVTLNGQLRLYTPRLQVSMTRSRVNQLAVHTTAQLNMTASVQGSLERRVQLFVIPIRVVGTGVDISVGLHIAANGQLSLEIMCRVETEFGIRNNIPFARTAMTHAITFDFHARVTAAVSIQARARVLLINVYGIEGNFGMGVQSNTALQGRCPQGRCFVIETFHVRQIRSLTDWGALRNVSALRFDRDLAQGTPPTFWYHSDWVRRRFCPHPPATSAAPGDDHPQAVEPTPAPEPPLYDDEYTPMLEYFEYEAEPIVRTPIDDSLYLESDIHGIRIESLWMSRHPQNGSFTMDGTTYFRGASVINGGWGVLVYDISHIEVTGLSGVFGGSGTGTGIAMGGGGGRGALTISCDDTGVFLYGVTVDTAEPKHIFNVSIPPDVLRVRVRIECNGTRRFGFGDAFFY